MPRYKIEGGQPLEGTITISGAKNAAVAIIPATLLVQGCCRIENVPDISDVHILLDILKQMGASVCQRSHDTVEIDCTNVGDMEPDPTLVRSQWCDVLQRPGRTGGEKAGENHLGAL